MKICVFSHARCRSSVLVTSLANAYNLDNFQENYDSCKSFSYIERKNIKKSTDKKTIITDLYTKKLQNYTNDLFYNDNFVIKLWPRWLNASEFCYNTEYFVKNLEECFRIQRYDKIILSDRDPVDSVCSLSLALKYGYNHNDKDKADYATKQKYTNVAHHNIELHQWNKSFIFEICLISKIREYFDRNKIAYTYVSFSQIPDYVNSLPDPNSLPKWYLPIDTKVNYKNAVTNYESLKQKVEDYKNSILPILNTIEF